MTNKVKIWTLEYLESIPDAEVREPYTVIYYFPSDIPYLAHLSTSLSLHQPSLNCVTFSQLRAFASLPTRIFSVMLNYAHSLLFISNQASPHPIHSNPGLRRAAADHKQRWAPVAHVRRVMCTACQMGSV
ncbi:hypothetical protein FZEAL_1834 [Fusarium zealandicum]|uniref:Uncharacterized protein n=1 Tax=Fusarium zealandicum TaxID=1053134 RepID=A0A8H4URZ6_9HYPO|nr:hypothetical protein FZEAL_1834 [Fusarium zealandicum]